MTEHHSETVPYLTISDFHVASTFSHSFFLFPLNFFLCFLIPFPLNVSPRLTSLLTLTGVGKKLEDTQPTSLSGVLSHCCRFSLEVALGHKTWETNINGYLNHRCSLLYPSPLWKPTNNISHTTNTQQTSYCLCGTPIWWKEIKGG